MVSLAQAFSQARQRNGGRGLLVTLEGIDGCGKSTQARLLADRLKAEGLPVVLSREPTEGVHGREIRRRLARAEAAGSAQAAGLAELFLADRAEHVAKLIEPALATGKLVLLDRYYHSSAAYQGAAGLDPQSVLAASKAIAPAPDLTLLLDLTAEQAAARLARADRQAAPDGFEQRLEFQQRVRAIYLGLAAAEGFVVVDAVATVEEQREEIYGVVSGFIRGDSSV